MTERAGQTVWVVCRWHTPWVSHGYEPVSLHASKEAADRRARERNERDGIVPVDDRLQEGEYDVDEWEVEP